MDDAGAVSSKRAMTFLSFIVMIIIAYVSIFMEKEVKEFIFEGFFYIVLGGLFSVASEKFSRKVSEKFGRRDEIPEEDFDEEEPRNRWEQETKLKPVVIERAVPTNKELYSRVKSRIKKKFKVWPSAYASAALVKAYKAAGGGYRNESVTIENPGYRLEGYVTNCEGKIVELHFGLQEVSKNVLGEAEYRGRKVSLGKPFRTPGGPKKFAVYVKNPKGNVVKVNFGHKGEGGKKTMKIKKSNAARRRSFRARHRCHTAKDRTTPRYWSCRFGWPSSGKGAIDKT